MCTHVHVCVSVCVCVQSAPSILPPTIPPTILPFADSTPEVQTSSMFLDHKHFYLRAFALAVPHPRMPYTLGLVGLYSYVSEIFPSPSVQDCMIFPSIYYFPSMIYLCPCHCYHLIYHIYNSFMYFFAYIPTPHQYIRSMRQRSDFYFLFTIITLVNQNNS